LFVCLFQACYFFKVSYISYTMPRNCVNSPDNFCHICGEVTFSTWKRPLTPMVKKAYECSFGCKVGDQDKKWAPQVCYISCATILREWLNIKGRSVTFVLPMMWREPTDHLTDCYFCIVPPLQQGITKKKKQTVNYPNILSAIRPVPHTEDLPVPVAAVYFRFRRWAYRKLGEDTWTFSIYRCWFYCWSSI